MLLLDENSNISQQEGLPVIAGLAVSMLFQPPLIALQSAMPLKVTLRFLVLSSLHKVERDEFLKDMNTSTGAFLLFRMIGSAVSNLGRDILSDPDSAG